MRDDNQVEKLIGLAEKLKATRTKMPSGVYSFSEIPASTPEHTAAFKQVSDFGKSLDSLGGIKLMLEVYENAVEKHGWRSVSGVSVAWHRVGNWQD